MKRFLLLAAILLGITTPAFAQKTERDSAVALFDSGKHREALPLLEKLVAAGSPDRAVYVDFGFALLGVSGESPDADTRKKTRARARTAFKKAVDLGSTDAQVLAILEALPEDGGADPQFSANTAVNQAMTLAEAGYSTGDFRAALVQYQKALALDPSMYDAAVFSGDAYLKLQLIDSAYLWYAKATVIDPDRSTAWRYWSDVLLKHNDIVNGGDKALEALIADPYNNVVRQGLATWATAAKTSVGYPKVGLPIRDTAAVHSAAWTAYDSVRRAWKGADNRGGDVFRKQFPADPAYRHSLAEEVAALQAAYRVNANDPATANLKRMDDAGVLEAYILFVRPDAGIASDYAAYRRTHRDALKKFWTSFVFGAPYSA